jgi:hypothetical protein
MSALQPPFPFLEQAVAALSASLHTLLPTRYLARQGEGCVPAGADAHQRCRMFAFLPPPHRFPIVQMPALTRTPTLSLM